MTSYQFNADYDLKLQERAARIIMLRDTGRARGLAAESLAASAGASRQARLDRAIRLSLAVTPRIDFSHEEMRVITSVLWSVDEDGFAIPPSH